MFIVNKYLWSEQMNEWTSGGPETLTRRIPLQRDPNKWQEQVSRLWIEKPWHPWKIDVGRIMITSLYIPENPAVQSVLETRNREKRNLLFHWFLLFIELSWEVYFSFSSLKNFLLLPFSFLCHLSFFCILLFFIFFSAYLPILC